MSARFAPQVAGTAREHELETVAWWAYGADVLWTFDEALAERLVTALQTRPS